MAVKVMPATAVGRGEREIHQGIDDPFTRKLVADQYPRGEQAQNAVDACRDQRSADAQSIGRQGARSRDRFPELSPAHSECLQEYRAQWNQHDQA
jgi:hypothetical protein